MRYQISGKQIDIGEALQARAQRDIDAVIEKYPGRPTDISVVFSKIGHEFVCETVIHLSTGLTVQARGRAPEVHAALDQAAERLDKQLRRYKRRLKDHHRDRAEPVDVANGASYVLAASAGDGDSEPESLQPIIIAEMETRIPSLTVGEAVMQMELAGAPVLVFRNDRQDDGYNIVYRREDGNIGWIDPNPSR